MKITIVCVGKVKEKYLRDAIAEYENGSVVIASCK